jgi:hypothetical protein
MCDLRKFFLSPGRSAGVHRSPLLNYDNFAKVERHDIVLEEKVADIYLILLPIVTGSGKPEVDVD